MTDIHFLSVYIIFIMNVMTVLIFVLFHLSVLVHFHDLFEHFSGMHSHLLGNLQDLRVELLKVNIVQVDLFVVIVFMFLMMAVHVIIFVHLSELLLETREATSTRRVDSP